MTDSKTYWKSFEEKSRGTPDDLPEFGEAVPLRDDAGWDRRSFLKMVGFSLTATAVACQRSVVEKAVPYLVQPEEIVPGRPYWLASTCGGCQAGCGILVKCRDGRPIKIEGNPQHPITKGGLCAVGQASVLELYDSLRLSKPMAAGKLSDWATVDGAVRAKLDQLRRDGGAVRFLTSSVSGPTERATIDRFLAQFTDAKHVSYDALSASSILDAHLQTHGVRILPRYRFDLADAVVSVDADFLGTWISPVEFTKGYSARRRVDAKAPKMNWHAHFEPAMSLTGSNADQRFRIDPLDAGAILAELYARVAKRAGVAAPELSWSAGRKTRIAKLDHLAKFDRIADRLWQHRGSSLVISGSAAVTDQLLVNGINQLLGNYGSTIDVTSSSLQRQGDDAALAALRQELRDGKVAALFISGVNPLFDLAHGTLQADLQRVPLIVSFAQRVDETSKLAHFIAPQPHDLEAWRDHEPVDGTVSISQPAIPRLGESREMTASLSAWMGEGKSAYDLIRETWSRDVAPRSATAGTFDSFWDQALHDGFAKITPARQAATPTAVNPATAVAALQAQRDPASGSLTLVAYPSVGMLDGRHAHNAWLHEMPDPITKATWDNYASISPSTARRLKVEQGNVIQLERDGQMVELPAFVQPGQADDTIAVALGYGRIGTERFAEAGPKWMFRRNLQSGPIGRNVTPLLASPDNRLMYVADGVKLTNTGRTHALAVTQMYSSMKVPENLAPEGKAQRHPVEETTLAALVKNPRAGKPEEHHVEADLWEPHPSKGHRWAMALDLTACTGCSGCVISCQAENNIPVVGKDEVLRQREMHWMRIDRYYAGDDDDVEVVHQPLMCGHCENASCESVCPVLATVHSSEGLNQQVYNRCVGTRYCANNCAYKARRFNWFDYPREDKLQNMVLNPDVVVRSRGVMEKCSMCVQRIEFAKMEAKRLGRPVADGDVQLACQQSCPADAIVFGDLNDPKSRIAKLRNDPRHYLIFDELNLRPAVGYLRLVRNREETEKEILHV